MAYIIGEWYPGTEKGQIPLKGEVASTPPINTGGENGTYCVAQFWINSVTDTKIIVGIYDDKGDPVKEFPIKIKGGQVVEFGSGIAFPVPNDCTIKILGGELATAEVSGSIIIGSFAAY